MLIEYLPNASHRAREWVTMTEEKDTPLPCGACTLFGFMRSHRKGPTVHGKTSDKAELSLALGRGIRTAVTDKPTFNSLTNKHRFLLVC